MKHIQINRDLYHVSDELFDEVMQALGTCCGCNCEETRNDLYDTYRKVIDQGDKIIEFHSDIIPK